MKRFSLILIIFFSINIFLTIAGFSIAKFSLYPPLHREIIILGMLSSPIILILAISFLAVNIYWLFQKAVDVRLSMSVITLCCVQVISILCLWFIGFPLLIP